MLNPHCRGTASQWSCCKHCGIKPEVRNKKWRPPYLTYDFRFCPRSVDDISIEELDPNNVGVAFGISRLPYLEPEIYVLPVWRPPSLIVTSGLIPHYKQQLR